MTIVQAGRERPLSLRSRIVGAISSLVAAGAVVVAGLTFSGFAARWWWRFEQACHFRVQYFWLLALAGVVLLMARRWKLAVLAALAAIVNVLVILPNYWPPPIASTGGRDLRVISFNVLSENAEREEVLAFVRGQQADLVLLLEVSHDWAKAIERLRDLYPHRHVVPREDNFGIALLSRIPWRDVQTVELGQAGVPTIVARFEIDQHPVVLIGTHPLPPGSRPMAALRDEQLALVAKLVRGQQGAAIVAGDLNTTDFSPCFRDLLATTSLRDSRQGHGIQASWGPFPFLEIAIDHCLVSPEIAVLQRHVGPHLGSDHRPVIVDLRFPATVEGTNRN
jgi:endonuclease/exonuclease/phosphatase (EEP) superfamily protein YafD